MFETSSHRWTIQEDAGDNSQEKESLKREKRKQKRRKPKTSKQADCITNFALEQEKDGEAAEKGMDTARADCNSNFALGVRNIQEQLTEAIVEGGRDAFFDVIDGAMLQVVNLHLESVSSAQLTQLCPSSTVASESWDSTITVNSFCQVGDGRDVKNAVLPESIGETEHMEAEEIELTEDVGTGDEGHKTEMVELQCIEQLYGPTASQHISREIPHGERGNFTFEGLRNATDNFANRIGEGSYGPVYRGCLPDGSRIAVKVNRRDNAWGEQAFWREVHCSFEHPAIVKMLGWCVTGPAPAKSRRQRSFFFKKKKEELVADGRRDLCIVMEYLERGSLCDQLFGDNVRVLEWPLRMKICIGASAGISFLHKQGMIHRDIKPGNILLDKNFSPKITDFGISLFLPKGTSGTTSEILSPRVPEILDHTGVESFMSSPLSPEVESVTLIAGTPGYLDPEYIMSSRVGQSWISIALVPHCLML